MRLKIVGASGHYTWYLSDGFIKQTTSPDFIYSFASPGEYTIRLKSSASALSAGQCSNDVIRTIRVGAKPKSNFQVFNNFKNSSTDFISTAALTKPNTKDPSDVINSWSWSWGETTPGTFVSSPSAFTNKTYATVQKDPYAIVHVAGSAWGCRDTVVRYIPIFPVETPSVTVPVVYDFNSTAKSLGWYESGQYRRKENTLSSWVRAVPNGKVIKGTDSSWITSKVRIATKKDTSGYYNNEKSWIESPCYDLRNLSLPMLSFDNWSQSDLSFDGVTLEYALCDVAYGEEIWTPLGTMGKGKNWFNSNSIISAPGGDPMVSENLLGWTGTDNKKGWLSSAYFLEEAKTKTSVSSVEGSQYIRFRIVFASNGDNLPKKVFDGFAFDNFFVGQRDRKVLIEEFCDYLNFESMFNEDDFKNNSQLIRIQYHTRYMNLDDEINNQNKGESGARNLLYGYSRLPRAAVDGYYSLDYDNLFFSNKGELNFNKRLLDRSPFEIVISNPSVSGNALNVSVDITRNTSIGNTGPFVVQVAALEKRVVGNGITFTNVFRKFLPDAAGEHIHQNDWPAGDTKVFNRSFIPYVELTPSSDTSIILVAFVQDEATSEVYQSEAVYVDYSMVQNLQKVFLPTKLEASSLSISLYPNPVESRMEIHFESGLSLEEYKYRIVDAFGKIVREGRISKDLSEAALEFFSEMPVGLYQIQLSGSTGVFTRSFSVVH